MLDLHYAGTREQDEFFCVQNMESLQFYGGFIAMQATLGASCEYYTS